MGFPFNAEFSVPAAPEAVMGAFADVPAMAALMPGAQIDGRDEDGAWRGAMAVAFGPKRIRFNGKVTLSLDAAARSGELVGRGTADARSARVESRIRFDVRPDGKGSVVAIAADTSMTGVLADFARSGGPVVARALLEQFSERLRVHLAAEVRPADRGPERVDAAGKEAPALGVFSLLWTILRQWLRRAASRT